MYYFDFETAPKLIKHFSFLKKRDWLTDRFFYLHSNLLSLYQLENKLLITAINQYYLPTIIHVVFVVDLSNQNSQQHTLICNLSLSLLFRLLAKSLKNKWIDSMVTRSTAWWARDSLSKWQDRPTRVCISTILENLPCFSSNADWLIINCV